MELLAGLRAIRAVDAALDLFRALDARGRREPATLLGRLLSDDASALDALYRRECRRGVPLRDGDGGRCRRRGRRTHDAFVALAIRPAGFDAARGELGAYLTGIARHSLLVAHRLPGLLPRGPGVLSPLGSKEIEGVRVDGERTTWTIEAGRMGIGQRKADRHHARRVDVARTAADRAVARVRLAQRRNHLPARQAQARRARSGADEGARRLRRKSRRAAGAACRLVKPRLSRATPSSLEHLQAEAEQGDRQRHAHHQRQHRH